MKKRLLACLTAVMMAAAVFIGFTACGGGEDRGYDLSYVSWNVSTEAVNNIERRMIAEFERRNDVRVQVIEAGTGGAYQITLIGLAATGQFPDVFMTPNLSFGFENGYFANIDQFAEDDDDWANIPTIIKEAAQFRDRTWAIPAAMHMMGFFVNDRLLDDQNMDPLPIAPDMDDLLSVVRALRNPTAGRIGLNTEENIFEWYAASVDDSLGWFAWDAENEIYALDSPAFRAGMALTQQIRGDRITFSSLEESELGALSVYEDAVAVWDAGMMGLRWGQTFEVPDMLEKAGSRFDISFVGVPGGRTPIVPDFLAISPTSGNPQLAWEFAKWMSFSPQGMQHRISLASAPTAAAEGIFMNTMPLTTNAAVIEQFFNLWPVDGLREVFMTLDEYGIVEGVKVTPGYAAARWTATTGIAEGPTIGELLDNVWNGSLVFTQFSGQLQTLASLQASNAINRFMDIYLNLSE